MFTSVLSVDRSISAYEVSGELSLMKDRKEGGGGGGGGGGVREMEGEGRETGAEP